MKKFLVLFALIGLFATACDDDEKEPDVVSGTPALSVELNASVFMPGDVMTATITDISSSDVTRGDITLNFSVIDLNTSQFDHSMFTNFHETAVLGSSAKEVTVDFVVGDVDQTYSLRLVTEAAGCSVTGANQNFTVSTSYLVNLSVTGSETGVVNEGDTFTITASTEMAPSEDLTVTLSFESGAEQYLDPVPASITIPAGKNSAVSEEITMLEDDGEYQDEITITVEGATDNGHYETADILVITRMDKDSGKDSYLTDERWVYENPDQAFVSSDLLNSYINNGNSSNYTVVTSSNRNTTGSSHPNQTLASEGWELVNAAEFHYGWGGWGLPTTALSGGRFGVTTQNGWAQDNTVKQQDYCFLPGNNNSTDASLYYNDVQEGGILRLFSAYQNGYNTSGDLRYIGADAIKCCTGSVVPAWGPISQGTRVEIRAKLGGNRQGFAFSLKIKDNNGRDWPVGGEIDVLQNFVWTSDPTVSNTVGQGVYYGPMDDPIHVEWSTNDVNIEDWNIYWAEIVDDTTIKLGVNGQTNITITSEDEPSASWPFQDTFTTSYYYLVMETGVALAVDTNDSDDYKISGDWADASFKNISFDEALTSTSTPHMYVDWVRVWRNNGSAHAAATNTNAQLY